MEDIRTKMKEHFSGSSDDHGKAKWSALWDVGNFLPWDRGKPNPALEDTLVEHHELFGNSVMLEENGVKRRKRALVPGCGKGYDVSLLASFGYDAYGLEISESAAIAARKFHDEEAQNYPIHDPEVGKGKTTFLSGDFFGKDWEEIIEGEASFEVIYDYTFLCALEPSMRPAWSERMTQLLSRTQQSSLICLEFPTYKDPASGGPPHGLPAKVYMGHLSHPGEKLEYDSSTDLIEEALPSGSSDNALVCAKRWRPTRTHEIGKDTDWVSVWTHQR